MDHAVLIEDHPLMAEAVGSSLWRWLPALQVVRAYSLTEAQSLLEGHRTAPAFIITDLQLPGSPPERTLQRLRTWQPKTPLLALTMLDDAPTHQLCAQYAARHLCKSTAADQLRQALQDWLGPGPWMRWSAPPQQPPSPLADLTSRQREILRELAHGRSNREIGDILHISEDTVRSHMKALFVKLEVKNRTQASKLYLQHKGGLHPSRA